MPDERRGPEEPRGPQEARSPREVGEAGEDGRRLYKARRPDGEVAWVDHEELWRLQQAQAAQLRRRHARRRRRLLLTLAGLVAVALVLAVLRLRTPVDTAPRAGAAADEPKAASAERIAGKASPGDTGSTPSGAPEAATSADGGPADDGSAGTGPAAPLNAEPAATTAPTPPAESEPGTEAGALAGPPEPAASQPAAPEPGALERVAAAVRAWADAWARQDVAAYLASYAASFEPAEGLDRTAWVRQRRRRLVQPSAIRVEIEALEVSLDDRGRAEARFVQTYDSPAYSDVVRKSLLLVEEEGEWRIVRERASPL